MIRALFQIAAGRGETRNLTDAEWREMLAFADRTQLSLYLRGAAGLPSWLAEDLEIRQRDNLERRKRLRIACAEVCATLSHTGIEFALLKGFTHETPGFGGSPCSRVQYDLDFLVRPEDVTGARHALQAIGYAPHGEQSLSAEHSHPLVRPHHWQWHGNYFDPDMPIPVELHDSLWSPRLDRVHAAGLEQFWTRRVSLCVGDLAVPVLDGPDRAGFAALHALRHVLRHDARPAHVLELARFLDARGDDAGFWRLWRDRHTPRLRSLETVAFRFAREWYGCAWPEPLAEEWSHQPRAVTAWFRDFAWSPVANLQGPNKDTVWLHMSLAEARRDRLRIFFDRLAPLRLPHRHEPAPYRSRFLQRTKYHAGAFAPALGSGLRWWWRRTMPSTASQMSDWYRRRV
jgi:hypothetical protein